MGTADLPTLERKTVEDHYDYHRRIEDYNRLVDKYRMFLGRLSSVVLPPACPVCRLIFRILPREGLSPTADSLWIVPFPSYARYIGWEKLVDAHHSTAAIFLGVDHTANFVSNINHRRMGSDSSLRQSQMPREAISLTTSDTFRGRKFGNARLIKPLVDFSFPKQALEYCRKHHGSFCEVNKPPELSHIRMIDIVHRKVIPSPEGCDYFALSYVWGGVIPSPRALEKRSLPQTIEDAVTATKEMGYRYLWVDALCIARRKTPHRNSEPRRSDSSR